MRLTVKDAAGTVAAALVVLSYVGNVQGWWYLGSNRWAAVTMAAVGGIACPIGARVQEARLSGPFVLLGLLGVGALVLAVVAIVSAAQWALAAFAIVVVALWAGTTLRHAAAPPPRLAVR